MKALGNGIGVMICWSIPYRRITWCKLGCWHVNSPLRVCRSKWLAKMADPWVRLVDPFIGEAVGMRVDVDLEDGTTAAGLFVHKLLSESVGCVR